MIAFTILGFPLSFGILNSIFTPNKKALKATWALSGALAIAGAVISDFIYKKSLCNKDFEPQSFYKWGGFKVVEKKDN